MATTTRHLATRTVRDPADVLFRLDAQLRLLFVSDTVERIAGFPASIFVGRTARELGLADDGWTALAAACARAAATGTTQTLDLAQGSRRFRVRVAAQVDGDACFLGAAAEVTARDDDDERIEEVERALRRQDLSRAMLSHDLRGPLAAILLGVEVVARRGPGDETNARLVQQIGATAARMNRMIEQLLELARIDEAMPVRRQRVDVGALAQAAIDELALARPTRVVRLHVEGDVRGSWDPDRLAQLLGNLVENALAHGDGGAVFVRVRGDGCGVIVAVENGGTEIPVAERAQLFDPFRRGTRGDDGHRGLGLGLYIAREIARAHGGDVELTSTCGQGTTVTVTLPHGLERD
jgi:signal transduction histidine kinase